jgi:imidazolonepropionase-like amidohydrolase
MVVKRTEAAVDITYEYNDRGRGEKTATHAELDDQGLVRVLDVTGNDYWKAAVDEHLHSGGTGLSWSNGVEQGSSTERAFYVAFFGPPELHAVLARALLRAPDHKLAILPTGEARIEKGNERTVEAGGQRMHVTRWDVIGLSFTPAPLWLDDNGELFAEGAERWSIVREGFKDVMPQLLADQNDALDTRFTAVAEATAQPEPAAGYALTHARIFDVVRRTASMGTIVVQGERIVASGPAVQVPPGAREIDLAGKTVLPGLWDMHTHTRPRDGLLNVAAGVTSVRDLGNEMDLLLRVKRSWDSGETVGPRLLCAGMIDGRGPYQGRTKVLADNEAEAKAGVEAYAKQGCVQIKIYSSLNPALVPGIVADAHARGMRVSGHVPFGMLASDFVQAGADEIQHVNFLFLNFLATREDDTRTPLRISRVTEKGATLDLAAPPVRNFIRDLARRRTVVDPTVAVFVANMTDRRGEISSKYAHVADRLPVQVRREALAGGLPVPEGMDATFRASSRKLLEMVKALYDAGVTIVAGTDDSVPGFALDRELELYVEAGIPAPMVLQIATLGAARVMKRDRDLGSIQPGKLADLVVVDGKPDQNIADIERVSLVIKGGVARDPKALWEALGIAPWK